MKRMTKITAAALSVLLLGSLAVPAFAEDAAPSEKEEVIYVMTDAAGQVTDVEAVNIFAGGDITDYGDYSAVKLLNTTDAITQDGSKINFSSSADKVYYQGTMKDTDIPWNISIRYFLDGKEYSAEEIAGKSGALEIRFSVSKNESCGGSFYEDYALQASFTLDTDLCRNISSSGATVANVGSSKQLTYTILPGKGIDTVIRADVTDFEMDSAAINGVRLHMSFEVDDAELMDKVDEIISAIGSVNDGASAVRDGTGRLYDATGTLYGKVGELHDGVGALADGAGELYAGLRSIAAKNDQLTGAAYAAYEGLCTAVGAALNAQLSANGMEPVTLTPESYADVLLDLLEKMDAGAVYDQAYQAALQQVTAQVELQADALYRGYAESQANSIYWAYVSSQADNLYAQVAAQAVYAQLIESGYTEEQAAAFLQTPEGQATVAQAVSNMTDEQKTQILNAAAAQLTDEQKAQILQGAIDALTDEQKAQIRDAYLQQMMASDEVTSQISAAVATVSAAAEQVSELKGQLDSYGAFYQGLLDYTGAVSDAAAGAGTLKQGMDTLYRNTGTLMLSVGELNDAVGELYGGTKSLADGTAAFANQTADMDTRISEEIDAMTSSITGGDGGATSFVSDKNTQVDSVQFVIKTAAVEKAEPAADDAPAAAPLTFWQKLLRLFGLY